MKHLIGFLFYTPSIFLSGIPFTTSSAFLPTRSSSHITLGQTRKNIHIINNKNNNNNFNNNNLCNEKIIHPNWKLSNPHQNLALFRVRGGGELGASSSNNNSVRSSLGIIFSHIAILPAMISQTLVNSSPLRAIGALYAVAAITVIPTVLVRQAYGFSVGYGLSVASMSLAMLSSFDIVGSFGNVWSSPPSLLASVSFLYGIRLAIYLLLREFTVESKRQQLLSLDKSPPLKRIPFACMVSLLYTFMVTPVLFALRGGELPFGSVVGKVQVVGTAVCMFGFLLESVADLHKYIAKRKQGQQESNEFAGPTTWSYQLCRHPNYLGEILVYLGMFAAGCVSFGRSIVPWLCSSLGLWGIVSIMLSATKRLDEKQLEKYGGQTSYDDWRKEVAWPVIPFFN